MSYELLSEKLTAASPVNGDSEEVTFLEEALLIASVPIENCLNGGVHPIRVCQRCANPTAAYETRAVPLKLTLT